MAKRYPKFWQPAAADDYPTQGIVVDCESVEDAVAGDPPVRKERLHRWYAYFWRAARGRTTRTREAFGVTTEEFWYRLEQLLGGSTTTWMFCTPASRVLALLGFWELLEKREIITGDGGDNDRARGGGKVPVLRHVQRAGGEQGQGGTDPAVRDMREEMPGVPAVPAHTDRVGGGEGDFGSIIVADPPILIFCRPAGSGGKLRIMDTANYGPAPTTWPRPAPERCRAQGEWIQRAVGILRDNNLGSWRCTAGGQAVYSFRRRLMPQAPYAHGCKSLLRLEREAYHGGRCECFAVGRVGGPVYHLDVRSLYPWCAWRHDLPISPEDIHGGEPGVVLPELPMPSLCCGDVTIATDAADYPVSCALSSDSAPRPVPVGVADPAAAVGGQVCYPVGVYRTVLYGPELHDALLHGRVVAVHRLATYHGGPILAPFCATWYGLLERARLDDDKPTQAWVKKVMVSLIGRFGETGKRWVDCAQDPEHGPYSVWTPAREDGRRIRYRNVAWHTQREELAPESADSIPSIAGYVASLGRLRLLQLLRIAGRDHCYYCDTDSVICDEHAYQSLLAVGEVRESEPGYLRLQGVHKRATFYGVKHYELDGKVKCAGLPRGNAEESGTAGQAWWRQNLGDALAGGRRPEARKVLLHYARSGGYKHGVVGKDGRVTPWRFGQSDSPDTIQT